MTSGVETFQATAGPGPSEGTVSSKAGFWTVGKEQIPQLPVSADILRKFVEHAPEVPGRFARDAANAILILPEDQVKENPGRVVGLTRCESLCGEAWFFVVAK